MNTHFRSAFASLTLLLGLSAVIQVNSINHAAASATTLSAPALSTMDSDEMNIITGSTGKTGKTAVTPAQIWVKI